MLVAAALCPAAPVLVPELSQGAAAEADVIRGAAELAVADVLGCGAPRLVVVSVGLTDRVFGGQATAGFASLGVDLMVPPLAGPTDPGERLPTPLAVGRWLLARAGHVDEVTWCTVEGDGGRLLGQAVAASPEPISLLVLGEASAALGAGSPLPLDERAARFDATVADAVAAGDARGLASLDRELAASLGATGWAPWQALAASAGTAPVAGRLLAYGAPYGVGYLVGYWALR